MIYRHFNIGDLVQIDFGNKPLGIIHGPLMRKYGDDARSYSNCVYHYSVNYLQYPVLISDMEETSQNSKWYWPGGLIGYDWDQENNTYNARQNKDPLIAYIHPLYLIFLTEL